MCGGIEGHHCGWNLCGRAVQYTWKVGKFKKLRRNSCEIGKVFVFGRVYSLVPTVERDRDILSQIDLSVFITPLP